MFERTDGKALVLSNIEAQVVFESIQVLGTTAATAVEYFYFDKDNSPTGKAGWFYNENDSLEVADNIEINEGNSILFSSQGTKDISFSGKVATSKKCVVTAEKGFTMIGNNTPAPVKFKDLICEGINTFDSIQFMDENLSTATEYFYFDKDNSPTGEAGWFYDNNDSLESADDIEIKAGTGMLFNATAGSVTISFPSAL